MLRLFEAIPDNMKLLQSIRVPILMYTSNKKKKDKENPGKYIKYKSTTMCSINNWATIVAS